MEYKTLEPNNLSSLGVQAPSFNGGGAASLFATTSFLWSLFFVLIVMAAFSRYVVAGGLRMQASESSIRQSNEIIKKVTFGLVGVFSLFILLFTVNKGLVTGDVGLEELRVGRGGSGAVTGGITTQTQSSSGTSQSCESTQSVLTKVQSSGGLCSGTVCTILSGCNYQQYSSIINQATDGDAYLRKIVIVTICKESRGNFQAKNQNPDGSYDCGLMQINQKTPCEEKPSQASQEANIYAGVKKIRETLSTASKYALVPGVPQKGNAFASYNCCSNGTQPASPSNDCTPTNGFPANFPKWACPINPGDGKFNMCSVKNYACELTVCLEQL